MVYFLGFYEDQTPVKQPEEVDEIRLLQYKEAMDILAGVTLESLVVARRVAKAIYRKAELGMVDLREFPLMTHVNDVLDNGKDAQLPWESFTFDHTK